MNNDFLDELGELALGTRLKRLSERMLADAAGVYQHFNMDIQPKWFTLLALLHRKGDVGVVDAAARLGISQPAISQFCSQLVDKGLVETQLSRADSRKRMMRLTQSGRKQIDALIPIWDAVQEAAQQLCEELENDFYHSLQKLETSLERRSLLERTKDKYNVTG